MDFILLLIVTGVLFLRPQDFVPDLAFAPVYLCCLLGAALVAGEGIVRQFSPTTLARRPVTICVLGMLGAIVLSQLVRGCTYEARVGGTEFAKVLLYYLLLVAVIRTPDRLRTFLAWLAVFFAGIAALALLEYHGIIDLPHAAVLEQRHVDEETGEITTFPRLIGIGLFSDPNDLCLILLAGMGIAVYHLAEGGAWPKRLPWVGLLIGFGYALALTQSRGGFIALMVGMMVLFHSRFGWWKALALGGAALPVLFLAFAGRQTSFAEGGDAGQDRFSLWSEGLQLFKESPLFGIGQGEFEGRVGLVAHNSYVHCYAELGFLGGTLFLGAFATALWGLYRLGQADSAIADPRLRRLRPYLLAIVAAYAVGILSLTRCYIVPTYLMLGLAVTFAALAGNGRPLTLPRFTGAYVGRLAVVSAAFVVALHVLVRAALHRG